MIKLLLETDDDNLPFEPFVYGCYYAVRRKIWFEQAAYDWAYSHDPAPANIHEYIPIGSVEFVNNHYKYIKGFGAKNILKPDDRLVSKHFNKCKLNELPDKFPVFVKPQRVKGFTGTVLEKPEDIKSLKQLAPLLEYSTDIFYHYDICNFESEWRIFIHKGNIIGVSNYAGRCNTFPDGSVSYIVADANRRNMPVAYTIDIGYDLKTHDWKVIEYNDFWALGIYGCDPEKYLDATVDRWKELIK